jgi:hypothetical protein
LASSIASSVRIPRSLILEPLGGLIGKVLGASVYAQIRSERGLAHLVVSLSIGRRIARTRIRRRSPRAATSLVLLRV